jgi:hypothetical protein
VYQPIVNIQTVLLTKRQLLKQLLAFWFYIESLQSLSPKETTLLGSLEPPLLSATRMVTIADFLERFDALVILMMVAGVFFKIGGWLFGAAMGISHLFKLKQTTSVFLGLGTIITPLSLLTASNQIKYNEIGLEFVTKYVHIPLQIAFPI